MDFNLISRNTPIPKGGKNIAYLKTDNWNDHAFFTLFSLTLYDENGAYHEIGPVKIGFKGQEINQPTHRNISDAFTSLPPDFFSLGTDLDYYQRIGANLSVTARATLLIALKDIVFDRKNLEIAKTEKVFSISLLRDVSLATIEGQFKRVLNGGVPLTAFNFIYKQKPNADNEGIELSFQVEPGSKPNTNIHAIIGRNGVGKTTLLNGMIKAIVGINHSESEFLKKGFWQPEPIDKTYFSNLVSVSFSIFDMSSPQKEQLDASLGTRYHYIGLKNIATKDEAATGFKNITKLHEEFTSNLWLCLNHTGKKARWLNAIKALESDENFAVMNLAQLANVSPSIEQIRIAGLPLVSVMSSGHAIVLIIITNLVATVEEKTLILIDEPETHLHPPLLSAFIRALSDLLHDRNGVAIVATHSPVVLQEMPKSCVWNVIRSGARLDTIRPCIETFGENVGILTRAVFGLEVTRSGFHKLLENAVAQGASFDQIMSDHNNQLGFEAQAILRALVHDRDRKAVS